MAHRLNVEQLPRTGAVEVLVPRCARQPGVRLSGVAVQGEALLYVADGGGLTPGLYREALVDGAAELLRPDDALRALAPRAVGERVLCLLQRQRALSSGVEAIALLDGSRELLRVPGQAVAASADGTRAVVLDLPARCLRLLELDTLRVVELAGIDGGLDPLLVVDPWLADDAAQVLFMDARSERCDASLELRELPSGAQRRLLGPLPASSWIAASLAPDGSVLGLSCMLGEEPRGQLWRLAPGGARSELLNLPLAQPCCAPVAVGEGALAALLSLEPYPASTHGPVDLALLPTTGGAVQRVTRTGDLQGRLCVGPGHLRVEGGPAVWRVPLL